MLEHSLNVLLKTQISSSVTKNTIVDENGYVNISIMPLRLVCKLQRTKHSFQYQFVYLMDEWIFEGQCPVYVCDISMIFAIQPKNIYPRLFAHFWSCA